MKISRLFALPVLLLALGSCTSALDQVMTYNCCINKQFYTCPEINTFTNCVENLDASGCDRDQTQDSGCGALEPLPCCIGTQFYTCPELNSLTACANNQDHSGCTRQVAKDVVCH